MRKRSSKHKRPVCDQPRGAHEIVDAPVQCPLAQAAFRPSIEASIDAAKQVQTASRMEVTEKLSMSKCDKQLWISRGEKDQVKSNYFQWASSDFWQETVISVRRAGISDRRAGIFLTGEQWFITGNQGFLTENVDFWQDISGFLTREQGFLRWWFFSVMGINVLSEIRVLLSVITVSCQK